MNLRGRLEKVEAIVGKERRRLQLTACKGMDLAAVMDRIGAAVAPDDEAVACSVLEHMLAALDTPVEDGAGNPMRDTTGEIVYRSHPFADWVYGLMDGYFSLPERLPRAFLEGMNSRHGAVAWRCEDCRMGHGNAFVPSACAVCGGRLERQCLWAPGWQTQAEYEARTRTAEART